MNTLFTGYYGHLNTGDDAFNIISDWGARKFWRQEDVQFFGRNLPKRLDGSDLKSSFKFRGKFKGQEILEIIPAGIENSKIIYAGGSVFHTEIKGLTKNVILQYYKKLNLLELGAIGVSLGPFKRKEDYNSIREYLSKFSFLALRDRRSYDIAMEMDLKIPVVDAFDLAALLPEIYPVKKIINKSPVFGVSMCNYERFKNGDVRKEQERNKKIIQTLKLLIKQIPDLKLKIFIFNGHPGVGDLELSSELKEKLPIGTRIEVINYDSNPYRTWNEISSCDAVMATRLHAGIFSYFSKTPFLQVEYHEKCSDFLKAVNYPVKFRIGDFKSTEDEAVDKLIELLSPPDHLFDDLSLMRSKALLNFTSFQDFFVNEK